MVFIKNLCGTFPFFLLGGSMTISHEIYKTYFFIILFLAFRILFRRDLTQSFKSLLRTYIYAASLRLGDSS